MTIKDTIKNTINSDSGSILISVILGLGLAALFRTACNGPDCRIIRGPNPKEVNDYVYKIQGDCYKYTPYVTSCQSGKTATSSGPSESP